MVEKEVMVFRLDDDKTENTGQCLKMKGGLVAIQTVEKPLSLPLAIR